MNKKTILLATVLLLLGGVAVGIYLWTKPASVESTGKADFEMSTSALIAEFEKNEAAASQKYVQKIIAFDGRVTEVSNDTGGVNMILASETEGFSVNCGFDRSLTEKVKGVTQGDTVRLQCSCSGISKPEEGLDLLSEKQLLMARCSLINWKKHKVEIGKDIEHDSSANTVQP